MHDLYFPVSSVFLFLGLFPYVYSIFDFVCGANFCILALLLHLPAASSCNLVVSNQILALYAVAENWHCDFGLKADKININLSVAVFRVMTLRTYIIECPTIQHNVNPYFVRCHELTALPLSYKTGLGRLSYVRLLCVQIPSLGQYASSFP